MRMAFTFIASALAACQSTGVVQADRDSYYIGRKDGTPGLGVSLGNKVAVYREAREFCAAQGLEMDVLRENVTPAAPARLGSTELQFRCVEAGGQGKPLARDPDEVIEVRQKQHE